MKAAIYLRVSTKDQDPELQKTSCINFAESRGYEVVKVFQENLSGFKKDVKRPGYEEIKEMARRGEIHAVIVWALDRWVRSRDTILEDTTILKNYGCKLHSIKEAWLEAINIEGPLGKTIQDFLLGLIGSLAEMESQRKSERVKMAFEHHKGKKWGRPTIPKKTQEEVVNLFKAGKSIREICSTVEYWDKSRNKRKPSRGAVHKIISDFKEENPSFEASSRNGPFMTNSKQSKGGEGHERSRLRGRRRGP